KTLLLIDVLRTHAGVRAVHIASASSRVASGASESGSKSLPLIRVCTAAARSGTPPYAMTADELPSTATGHSRSPSSTDKFVIYVASGAGSESLPASNRHRPFADGIPLRPEDRKSKEGGWRRAP